MLSAATEIVIAQNRNGLRFANQDVSFIEKISNVELECVTDLPFIYRYQCNMAVLPNGTLVMRNYYLRWIGNWMGNQFDKYWNGIFSHGECNHLRRRRGLADKSSLLLTLCPQFKVLKLDATVNSNEFQYLDSFAYTRTKCELYITGQWMSE